MRVHTRFARTCNTFRVTGVIVRVPYLPSWKVRWDNSICVLAFSILGMDRKKFLFPWLFRKEAWNAPAHFFLHAPATFSESAELSCACPIFRREKFADPSRYDLRLDNEENFPTTAFVEIGWEIVTQWLSKLYRSPAIDFWPGSNGKFPLFLLSGRKGTRQKKMHSQREKEIQPGAVKLVLWRQWMHATQVHLVTAENQFHCTRL